MKLGLPVGFSTSFWFIIGFIRALTEKFQEKKQSQEKAIAKPSDIAVLLPAHNEETIITDCIDALKHSFKPKQIYIASDGSTDSTYKLAKKEKCNVLGILTGVGKAKALVSLINHYDLYNKYKFIFIIDADTRIDKTFVERALPMFNDPQVSVVFASARIHWPQHIIPKLSYYFMAYRERLNRMLFFFLMYGQTWKYTNMSYVIPGFATIYRSSVLKQMQIDTPGLLIEDFNLAFQFNRKKLGKVAFKPNVIGWDQYPDNLRDYWKQVKRWNIGFFQTVRRNGVWPSWFWVALSVFSFEVLLNSIFYLFLPFAILLKIAPLLSGVIPLSVMEPFLNFLALTIGPFYDHLNLVDIFVMVFWFDYAMTVVFGLMTKKPQFIIYGLFFFIMHYITSLILITSIIPGFFGSSDGRWVSPKRLKDSA